MRATTRIASGFWRKTLILFMVVMNLGACDKPKPPEQLVFADIHQAIVAPIYVAEANGYFKDENLTVTYKKFSSGRDSVDSVLSGDADIGVATEFPFAKSIIQGKDLRIVGTLHRTNANSALVARRDRGIEKANDLRGKQIGLTPNTNSDYILSLMLKEAGLSDDAAIRVPQKPEQLADALHKGTVDAVLTWQPHVANAMARFANEGAILIRTQAYTELSVLGVRPATIVEKREALQRMMNALVRAEDFIADNNAAALQIVIEHLGIKQEDAVRQAWGTLKFQVRLDNLLLTALTNEGTWLSKGAAPPLTVPDYRSKMVTDFLETARTQSVTVPRVADR